MRPIPFAKAQACGNDFILIEARHAPPDLAAATRAICDRHLGVGADGVERIFPDPQADARARLFNSDGSEAEISGNGTRCVAAWLAAQAEKKEFRVRTGAGIKTCRLTGREGQRFEFETTMGEPVVGAPRTLRLSHGEVTGIPVSMGNPHFVVLVAEFEPGWPARAAEIGGLSAFEHGVNVELVVIKNKEEIAIRIFERGAGETLSSGTGSCAAAVAAISGGRAHSPLRVVAPGGVQTVRWEQNQVLLRGPAQLVCRGEILA